MECVAKPSKPPSNISEIVSIFAKVCRLRSIGVFSSDNPNHRHYHRHPNNNSNVLSGEDSSDATEEAECDAERIHPQPPTEIPTKINECGATGILKLFDTISALKLAYLQFQEAHIPYDPAKIKAADELLVAKLEALCKIKRAYKEKQFKEADPGSSSHSALLQEKIQSQERLLAKLQSQIKSKNSEIFLLRQELQGLDLENLELVEKFVQKEKQNVRVLNLTSFQDTFKAVSKAIHDFAKPLISFMKASGWDLDLAANSIEDSAVYSKRSHKKYAFDAYIARRMFFGISLQPYYVDDTIRFRDPIDALTEDPDSGFAKFCRLKYLLVVHPKMEASFFGNLDQRAFVSRGKHPRTPFYRAFVKMAKWVWVLLGIAASIEPKAEIFGVKRGSAFSNVYMESVGEDKEDKIELDEGQAGFKVEFMVTPGFRIGEKLVRSRVYLSKMKSLDGVR